MEKNYSMKRMNRLFKRYLKAFKSQEDTILDSVVVVEGSKLWLSYVKEKGVYAFESYYIKDGKRGRGYGEFTLIKGMTLKQNIILFLGYLVGQYEEAEDIKRVIEEDYEGNYDLWLEQENSWEEW